MYYLEEKHFKKLVKDINRALFSGFKLLNRKINRENIYREQFNNYQTPFRLTIVGTKKEKRIQIKNHINKLKKKGASKTYLMGHRKRMHYISDVVSQVLGFKSFHDYKLNIKLGKKYPSAIDMPYSEYLLIKNKFDKALKNVFDFEESPAYYCNFLFYIQIREFKNNKLINRKYKNSEEIADLLAYHIAELHLYNGILNEKEILEAITRKESSKNIVDKIYAGMSMNIEGELYEPSSSKSLFHFCLNHYEVKQSFPFIDKIDHWFNLPMLKKDIQGLSNVDYEVFIENVDRAFFPVVTDVVRLIREDNENELIKVLKSIQSIKDI